MTKDIRSEGVERIARVLFDYDYEHTVFLWEEAHLDARNPYLSKAGKLWDKGIRDRSGFIYCLATKMIKPAYYKTGGS